MFSMFMIELHLRFSYFSFSRLKRPSITVILFLLRFRYVTFVRFFRPSIFAMLLLPT